MNRNSTLKTVYAALFTALVFVGTMYIKVPLPLGYFNFGDCFIILAAWLVGGPWAVFASAVGASLADLLAGYGSYAPVTLVIKAVMALAAYLIYKKVKDKSKGVKYAGYAVGSVAAEVIMVGGYYLYESCLYGFSGALASVPGNLLQGAAAIVSSVAVMSLLEATGLAKRFQPKKSENAAR